MIQVGATKYVLDVIAIESKTQLHVLLARVLRFPDYYGMNWDAFDECMSELQLPAELHVHGMTELERRLPRDAARLRECLSDAVDGVADGKLQVHVA